MAEDENKLGNYLLLEKIAQGGMAQVFKAKTVDPNGIERLVVIKRILPHIASDPEYVNMLIDEAKIAVHFNQGNIAQIYDLGRVGADYFMVMEYVDGKTIGQILRDFKDRGKPIPIDIIVYCISELCRGLDYMHRKTDADGKHLGVVHRDISPQNIIVSYSGTVKLIDFGVAKAIEKLSHTESGVLKGKFAYMSPEQAEGDDIDPRSDIFSAGILLWELLTQERLFKKRTNKETLKAVRAAHFVTPSKLREDIPGDLDSIVEKALRKKKEKRYQTAAEMGADLTRFLLRNYPDFKRIQVAEFLYRYFGPEADEEGLEPELPELAVPREPRPAASFPLPRDEDEEKTVIDKIGRVRTFLRSFRYHFLIAALLLLGTCGFILTRYLNREGLLVLEVIPSEALVQVDNQSLPGMKGHYEIKMKPGEKEEIKISYSGYVSFEKIFVLQKREKQTEEVILQKEIPPFGDLMLVTDPPGALVYVNDEEWNQKTPTTITHLSSGRDHKIGIYLQGHQFLEQHLQLNKGEQKNLSFILSVENTELEIITDPPGAVVSLEGQLVGATPYNNHRVESGKPLNMTLTLPGYEPITQTLTFNPGEKKKLLFDLKPREN